MFRLLESKYDILETIGQGGSGTVLKVKCKTNQQIYAAKILFIKDIEEEELLEIEKEINYMVQLECKYSLKYIESFKDDNYYYIISELCDCDLDKEIRRYNGLFPIEKIKKILTQLNNVFTLMNIKKILHRDIKPQNILVKYTNNDKTDFDVKLSDYGISKKLTTTQRAKTNKGFKYTKAPEVLQEEFYDEKADLWSLGVVIYYICLKKWPFEGKNKEIEDKIINGILPNEMPNSPLITDLITKLLQKDRKNRLNWEQYLNHPFFKSDNENNININNNNNIIIEEIEVDLSKVDGLYESIRKDSKIKEINNDELKNIINSDKKLRPSKILEFINSENKEISIIGLLLFISNYNNFFNRKYITKFFYSDNPDENTNWIIKIHNIKTINISEAKKQILINVINKIFNNIMYIISIYEKKNIQTNKEKVEEGTETFLFYIDSFFELLSNIYDLSPNFYELLFENEWINLYIELFDFYIDFDNPPKVCYGSQENYDHLETFLQFFSLCMEKDTDYSLRKKITENHKELLIKILKISTYTSRICCCFHGFKNQTYSSHKAIDSILKTLQYIENNNINNLLESEKYIKIQYTKFLSEKFAKNVCIVHLNKMAEILTNKEIFIYLIEETNYLKDMTYKESKSVHHCIDELEKLVTLCEYPEVFLKLLNLSIDDDLIQNEELRSLKRMYREMLKKVLMSCSRDFIEQNIYNNDNIFKRFIKDISNIDLIEAEGIYDILLNPDEPFIIDIFYKYPAEIGYYCDSAVNNLSKFSELKVNALFRIMIRFLSIGKKIKEKYGIENIYITQLKSTFSKIQDNNSNEYDELKKYFEN